MDKIHLAKQKSWPEETMRAVESCYGRAIAGAEPQRAVQTLAKSPQCDSGPYNDPKNKNPHFYNFNPSHDTKLQHFFFS